MEFSVIVGLIGLAVFLTMLFLGVPVSISMMSCGFVGAAFLLRTPTSAFNLVADNVLSTFISYTISVAPMFMFMGDLATETGIGKDLYYSFEKLFGHLRGGLACATQVVCAVFGAICGSQAATGAMMSRVAYPQMKQYHYDDALSTGCIASGSCLAILIPPSLALINYGIIAETSITRLLMGGLSTGIVLMILFIITIMIWCRLRPEIAPVSPKVSAKEKWQAVRKGGFIEIIIVFAVAMGGMFAGFFTPTEAGAVGVAGMFLISLLFGRLSFGALCRALNNTLVMTGMIYCILAGAACFSKFFTLTKIPAALGSFVAGLNIPSVLVIVVITLMYLVLGCFIDAVPLMVLTTPIFLPVVSVLGYDSVWFGCYLVVLSGLGSVTPPVGMSCYIVSGACKEVPLQCVFKGSLPFVVAYLVMGLLMALVPGIATWLPNALL